MAGYLDAGFRSAVLQVADPDVTRGTMNSTRGRGPGPHRPRSGPRTPSRSASASILGGHGGLFPSDHDAVIATLELGR